MAKRDFPTVEEETKVKETVKEEKKVEKPSKKSRIATGS